MQRKYRKFPEKMHSFAKTCVSWKMRFFPPRKSLGRKNGIPGDFALEPSSKVVFVLDPFTDETLENSSCRIERNRSQGDEKQASVSTSLSLESWDRFLTGSPE